MRCGHQEEGFWTRAATTSANGGLSASEVYRQSRRALTPRALRYDARASRLFPYRASHMAHDPSKPHQRCCDDDCGPQVDRRDFVKTVSLAFGGLTSLGG